VSVIVGRLGRLSSDFCVNDLLLVEFSTVRNLGQMSQNVFIRLASQRIDNTIVSTSEIPKLFTPGEIITCQSGFMR